VANPDWPRGGSDRRGVPSAPGRGRARWRRELGLFLGQHDAADRYPRSSRSRTRAMRIVVVVQARTGSTRLPGKVLMPLANRPLLHRMLERVLAANTPSEVVLATTLDCDDDVIERVGREAGAVCFRGHPTDLLDRHYLAGLAFRADV